MNIVLCHLDVTASRDFTDGTAAGERDPEEERRTVPTAGSVIADPVVIITA